MDNTLLIKILGISFIFVLVTLVAFFNVTKINYYANKQDAEKAKKQAKPSLYEVKKGKK